MSYFPIKIVITEPRHLSNGERFTVSSPESLPKGIAFKVLETSVFSDPSISQFPIADIKELLNRGHFSEAMDRCSILMTLTNDLLLEQVAIKNLPALKESLQVVTGVLQNCYQMLGLLDNASSDPIPPSVTPEEEDAQMTEVIALSRRCSYYVDLEKTVAVNKPLYGFMFDS